MQRNYNRHTKYGRAVLPVEPPKPPGFICNGWREYQKIFRAEFEAFETRSSSNTETEKPAFDASKQSTLQSEPISLFLQDSYDENGEYNALGLASYNSKKPKEIRKILTAEEAEIMAQEAKESLAALKLQDSINSSTTEQVSALESTEDHLVEESASFDSKSDAELEVESECSSTDSIQDADNACSSNQSAEPESNQLENACKESTSAAFAVSTVENHLSRHRNRDISIVTLSKNGFKSIVLVESRRKTAIFFKIKTLERCVQKLEREFLPFYENFVRNRSEWFKTEGIQKEFSDFIKNKQHRQATNRPENRVIKFSIVKMNRNKPDSLLFRITECFTMVSTDKEVYHEISAPVSILPMLVQELRVVLQEILSEAPPLGFVDNRMMSTGISAADNAKLKEVLDLAYSDSDTKRFIKITEIHNSRNFVILSIPVAFECISNLNLCNNYYQNHEHKELGTCPNLTFLMTRNVRCNEGNERRFLVNLCVNQVEYLVSIKDWQKRNQISVSADLIDPFVYALRSMTRGSDACWKCSSTQKDHHQCDILSPPSQDTNNKFSKLIEHSANNHRADSELNIYRPKDRFRAKANARKSDQREMANFSYNSCVGNFKNEN